MSQLSRQLDPSQWFKKEREAYDRLVSTWLPRHKDQFVVIHGDRVLGFEKRFDDAVRLGRQHARPGQFMVRPVQSPNTEVWISHIVPG